LQSRFNKLCRFPSTQTWTLKYRASRDGFGADDFHAKCDGVAHTVTLIKSAAGNVFGGFTDTAWSSTSECEYSPKTFIFSLVNAQNKPFRAAFDDRRDRSYFTDRHGLYCSAEVIHHPIFS
jgi:hypothetical protein